ncbi:MAG: DUF2442 domain-containing protein [Clostridia bacterium]|nr:DUF2442 domain-containing protein [Clostridia bacterium]
MKIFAIKSESGKNAKIPAYLIYYENTKTFYIELDENADEWETPLILSSFLRKGEKTVDAYHSRIWVQQRIVPPDRQNLGQILKENGLDSYDEYELLMLSKGRCAQDDYYLSPVTPEKLPAELSVRFSRRIEDVVPLKNNRLIVFFRNGEIKKCDVGSFIEKAGCKSVLEKYDVFRTVEILTGGYGVSWGNVLTIPSEKLYGTGQIINLDADDFVSFVSNRVISASQACEILDCSRQNISDLIKRGKLNPIVSDGGNTLLLKNEIISRKWY